MNLKALTRNYLAFQVFFALLFWLPVFYEVQKRLGLSDGQIFSIQSSYYLLFCVLELPTGWLADRFGMILSLRLGAWALVAAHVVVVSQAFHASSISPQAVFYAHFALIALARSLISGASNAYLYETLQRAGRGDEYVQLEGRARAYGLFAKILCWSVVGYITERYLLGSYWLSLISALFALVFAFQLPELKLPRAPGARGRLLWEGLKRVIAEPRLLGLMVQGMGVFVLARIVQVNVFQPLLLARGFTAASLGWVMAGMTAIEAWGSLRVRDVLSRAAPESLVSCLTALVAFTVISLSVVSGWGLLVSLGLFSLGIGFAGPIQRQVINGGIRDSSHRAVLLSFESLLDRLVCSLAAWLLGLAMSHLMMREFIFASGAVFLLIALTQWLSASRNAAGQTVQ